MPKYKPGSKILHKIPDENRMKKYMLARFPSLAAEFEKIPDELWVEEGANHWILDRKDDVTVLKMSFIFVDTPQGRDFWLGKCEELRNETS